MSRTKKSLLIAGLAAVVLTGMVRAANPFESLSTPTAPGEIDRLVERRRSQQYECQYDDDEHDCRAQHAAAWQSHQRPIPDRITLDR